MKSLLRISVLGCLLTCVSYMTAQQVSTLYFLENAPMRHAINPAFQPISSFYITLPIVGYTNAAVGTNGWALSDFSRDEAGLISLSSALSNSADWLKGKPRVFALSVDMETSLLGLGFRVKDRGYFHLNISERLSIGMDVSNTLFTMNDPSVTQSSIISVGANVLAYTNIAAGYSHVINDHWTVGGKLKVLLGEANVVADLSQVEYVPANNRLYLASAVGNMHLAAPLRWENLPADLENIEDINLGDLLPDFEAPIKDLVGEFIKPVGVGAAFDLGVTYKPIKNLQITASVTDLGFMRWLRHAKANVDFTRKYFNVEDYLNDHPDAMLDTTGNIFADLSEIVGDFNVSGVTINPRSSQWGMLTANLSVGVDANFWKNRIGVGVYSRTQFCNNRVAEELTFGLAIRPANWFQLAASYSLINGRGSNIGAALSLAPYDGVMLTLATDYVPLKYTKDIAFSSLNGKMLPYKTPGLNLSVGMAIAVGTNTKRTLALQTGSEPKTRKRDLDNDGVRNSMDLCPNTPLNVKVDANGCPFDTDGDGVADYLDRCPHTPAEAYGRVDSAGCPLDTDRDGVYDYLDACPNTPFEARNHVSVNGCPLDTDGDGVEDYLDRCPNTPEEATGYISADGCPLDYDGDGVFDYLDRCPNTPREAIGCVNVDGCPKDADEDGVYDCYDKCPYTELIARNHVDVSGCPLDTDGDGLCDYEDQCPTVPGTKAEKGCPEVKREVRSLLEKAMASIQFENGRAVLKESSYEILDLIADLFIENPEYRVEVQGHTDDLGQYDFNLDLSNRRAHSVRAYLVNQGVPASQLTARGYGSNKPIADNATKEGRNINTRVAFDITVDPLLSDTID